jgi:pyruvate-formate lyase-activating enzyme
MTFASRGCPVNCSFCIVPRIEGTEFTLDWDFRPAPILCDNNLSALPVDFQEHIIRRYLETGMILKDANSGFEPRTFDGGTYRRWKPILRGPWRFAFDTTSEEMYVKPMMDILSEERAGKKQVYCLIGNEPFSACYERFQKIIEWGGEPYCQPVMPLNALDRYQFRVLYDWTPDKLRAFQRYANRHLWRYIKFSEYKGSGRNENLSNLPGARSFDFGD